MTASFRARLPRDHDEWAAVGIVLAVTTLVVSEYSTVAGGLALLAVLCTIPSARRGLQHPMGRFAAATVILWPLYGALIGSLPTLTEPGQVLDWLDGDARLLYPFTFLVGMAGLSRREPWLLGLRVAWGLVVISTAISLALMPFLQEVKVFELLEGFTSSHHVMGALTSTGLIAMVGVRRLVPSWPVRVPGAAVLAAGLALSGSRASMAALAVGVAVVVAPRLQPRQVVAVAVLAGLLGAGAVAAIPRLRLTATTVLSPDFPSRALDAARTVSNREAFFELTPREIRQRFGAEAAERNIFLRIGLWSAVSRRFVDSPLLGEGAFRLNDDVTEHLGPRYLVHVGIDGVREFSDRQGHNTILHVSAETGLVGLVIFLAPFVLAWTGTTVRGGRREELDDLDRDLVWLVRGMLLAALAVGQVSEGVFSPSTGLPVAVLAIGGSALLRRPQQSVQAGHEDDRPIYGSPVASSD